MLNTQLEQEHLPYTPVYLQTKRPQNVWTRLYV